MSLPFQTDRAPQFPLPFSQALQAGDFVYVSGQVGVDPKTKEVVGDTIEEQTRQCLKNIEQILTAAGLTLDHIVKINAHVSRSEHIPAFNRAYEQLMKEPFPTRTTVQSGIGSYLVEIDAIAYTKTRRGEN